MFWYIVLIVLILFYLASSYNRMQKLAQIVRANSSNIIITVQRKVDLINKLTEIVGNYAKREDLVLIKVSDNLREMSAQSKAAIGNIHSMAQTYPEMVSNKQYLSLMDNLKEVEISLQGKREAYNGAVNNYNGTVKSIPQVFFAGPLGFKEAPYYDVDNMQEMKEFTTDDGEILKQLIKDGSTKAIDYAGKATSEIKKNIDEISKK